MIRNKYPRLKGQMPLLILGEGESFSAEIFATIISSNYFGLVSFSKVGFEYSMTYLYTLQLASLYLSLANETVSGDAAKLFAMKGIIKNSRDEKD